MEERKDEVCDGCEVHEDLLKIVNETLPEETELYDLAELFKVFGDSTRIRILFVLFEHDTVCNFSSAPYSEKEQAGKEQRRGKIYLLLSGR